MAQHASDTVRRGRAARRSRAGTTARLLQEAWAGESDWTLPILLGGILLFVMTVVAIVLTIVELAALLA
jgi:hypothetical protein